MTDPTHDLDMRRRRLRFRAWHRGMREMDLLMGRFVDARVDGLSAEEIGALEALMEAQDRDVYAWLTGEAATPPDFDTPLFRQVRAFHSHAGPLDL